ncbi:MAG: FixH family protein [Alphaproteobacteria bacterium]|nr:FixH family protein [Alphaproteobacteria bacterium]
MNGWQRFFASDRWIPWTFVAFFCVVFGVNAVLVGFAIGSWSGLTTDSAYRNGLAYNDQIEAARTQAALGWQVALDVDRRSDGITTLAVRIRNQFGRDISDARVEAAFLRPTHDDADIATTLAPRGNGLYGAQIELPLPGQWDLRLDVTKDGRRHQSTRRLHLS